jgi:hypothetical protein
MIPGLLGLGAIVILATLNRTFVAAWVGEIGENHKLARFGHGRFLRDREGTGRISRRFLGFVILMFGIFFVDSLGFLRIIDTPILVDGAWQAAGDTPRLVIGLVHVVTALVAGVLYTYQDERHLFYWIFAIFALSHFSYTLRVWLLPETTLYALGTPLLYATAVSLYTVVNFALWADLSAPRTISRNTAVGVAFSGWTATFISTALAIRWQTGGVSLVEHLRIVEALAWLFFLAMLLITFSQRQSSRMAHDA